MISSIRILVLLLVATCCQCNYSGWTSDDFALFDLVEEINRNFYELFGVEQVSSRVCNRF